MIYTNNDIDDYKNGLSLEDKNILIDHCNSNQIKPEITAWYDDLDDFYDEWTNHLEYSKEEADHILNNAADSEQFLIFEDGRIIRLAI